MAKFTQSNKRTELWNKIGSVKVVDTDSNYPSDSWFRVYQTMELKSTSVGDTRRFLIYNSTSDNFYIETRRQSDNSRRSYIRIQDYAGSDANMLIWWANNNPYFRMYDHDANYYECNFNGQIAYFRTNTTEHFRLLHNAVVGGLNDGTRIRTNQSIDMNGKRCRNAANAVLDQDYVTKNDLDTGLAAVPTAPTWYIRNDGDDETTGDITIKKSYRPQVVLQDTNHLTHQATWMYEAQNYTYGMFLDPQSPSFTSSDHYVNMNYNSGDSQWQHRFWYVAPSWGDAPTKGDNLTNKTYVDGTYVAPTYYDVGSNPRLTSGGNPIMPNHGRLYVGWKIDPGGFITFFGTAWAEATARNPTPFAMPNLGQSALWGLTVTVDVDDSYMEDKDHVYYNYGPEDPSSYGSGIFHATLGYYAHNEFYIDSMVTDVTATSFKLGCHWNNRDFKVGVPHNFSCFAKI